MQLELTYQMPFQRLAKLSRSMRFRLFRTSYLLAGLILTLLVAGSPVLSFTPMLSTTASWSFHTESCTSSCRMLPSPMLDSGSLSFGTSTPAWVTRRDSQVTNTSARSWTAAPVWRISYSARPLLIASALY